MKHPHQSQLQDYFENALKQDLSDRIRAHVENCDQCTGILTSLALIEKQLQSLTKPVVSQHMEARILLDASELLRKKRAYLQERNEHKEFIKEWKETILPEFRIPALQLASISIMLTTFILIEQIKSSEETVFEPLSTEVTIFEGDGNL